MININHTASNSDFYACVMKFNLELILTFKNIDFSLVLTVELL